MQKVFCCNRFCKTLLFYFCCSCCCCLLLFFISLSIELACSRPSQMNFTTARPTTLWLVPWPNWSTTAFRRSGDRVTPARAECKCVCATKAKRRRARTKTNSWGRCMCGKGRFLMAGLSFSLDCLQQGQWLWNDV